jgi:hypothetical protein
MLKRLPVHTPYDGSAKPFTIGLKPLDPARWLEIDGDRDAYLAEKRRLYAEIPEQVFVAEDDTRAAQQEVLDMIEHHLREYFPDLAAKAPQAQLGAGSLAAQPLHAASLLAQEDLVLMRRGAEGWSLRRSAFLRPGRWWKNSAGRCRTSTCRCRASGAARARPT